MRVNMQCSRQRAKHTTTDLAEIVFNLAEKSVRNVYDFLHAM
jgi:hypothetical protein